MLINFGDGWQFLMTTKLMVAVGDVLWFLLTATLMVIAWMIFASVGVIMPRYLKPYLMHVAIVGKQLWFQVNNTSNTSCTLIIFCNIIF